MKSSKRVVVTGLGPISAAGVGKDHFWKGILESSARVELEKIMVDGELWAEYFYYKVKDCSNILSGINMDRFNEIKEWKLGELDKDFVYLLAAIKLALEDSGLNFCGDLKDTSLVLAHENLGLLPIGIKLSHIAYEILAKEKNSTLSKKEFYEKFYNTFFKKGYDVQTFANLFHITKLFGIRNYSLFMNNACASGLYAFEAASQIIQSGLSKRVILACSDQADIYKYLWFKELGMYSDDGATCPFSKNRSGLVFGDGGAAVILEDFDEAVERGAPVYAEYLGGGFDLEGWKMTLPNLTSDSYQRAIKMCMDRAQTNKEAIDFLCPHGVGSQAIDYYEARAIVDIFGEYPERPLISTFKPYFGHNLGGSALLESIVVLLILNKGLIPRTLNSESTHPKMKIDLVKSKVKKEVKTAMKICCAFAGYNSAVLFKKM